MSPGGSAMTIPTDAAAGSTPLPAQATDPIAAFTAKLARGDEQAWHGFHAAYAPRLFRYLVVVTRGDETRAADALQATFVRAAKHVRRFDSEDVLWSWLTALARSAAVDEHRRSSRFHGFLTKFKTERTPPPPTPANPDSQLSALLESGLSPLPSDERELLTQKYIDGRSVRDIAAAHATTEKAIESRLSRTREKLRAIVLKNLDAPTP